MTQWRLGCEMSMKGARALAGALFLLAAVSAAPAASIAQDDGTAGVTPATPTTPLTPTPPSLPMSPSKDPNGSNWSKGDDSAPKDQGQQAVASEATSGPATSRSAMAHASASATVTMGDNFFSPNSVTVAVGDTVSWRNNGQATHNATASDGSFATGNISPGGSGSHTFSSAGTFDYVCTIHPGMNGTVRVLASSSGGGGGGGGGSTTSGSRPSEAAAVA